MEQDAYVDVIEPFSCWRSVTIVAVTILNASTMFFYTLIHFLPTNNTLGLDALFMSIIQLCTPGVLVLVSAYILPILIRQGFSSSKSSLLLTLVQSFNVIIVPLCISFILGKTLLLNKLIFFFLAKEIKFKSTHQHVSSNPHLWIKNQDICTLGC